MTAPSSFLYSADPTNVFSPVYNVTPTGAETVTGTDASGESLALKSIRSPPSAFRSALSPDTLNTAPATTNYTGSLPEAASAVDPSSFADLLSSIGL